MILNLHIRGEANVGDNWSAPLLYFKPRGLHGAADIRETRQVPGGASVIVGGGACLNCKLYPGQSARLFAWGAGHTSRQLGPHGAAPCENLGQYELAGSRDAGLGRNWVPCVSCLHPIFDEAAAWQPTASVVFFGPADTAQLSLREAVQKLAGGRLIVSRSYHGIYWALLLGRPVIGIPHGSKFYHFPVSVPLRMADDWESGRVDARAVPGFLRVCRAANIDFARHVFRAMGQEPCRRTGLTGEPADLELLPTVEVPQAP